MSTRFLVPLLAATLMVPQAAVGGTAAEAFRLPPIPYAETIPWLTGNSGPKPPAYLGLLLAPVPSALPPAQFAAAPRPASATHSSRYAADRTVSTEDCVTQPARGDV